MVRMMNKKGQSIVEFAIVLPLFLLLAFGCLYTGMLMHDYLAIGQLSREVARFEAVGTKFNNEQEIEDRLHYKNRLTSMYKVDKIDINRNFNPGDPTDPCVNVKVTMVANQDVINLVKPFMPKQLSTDLTMRLEKATSP